MMPDRKRWVSVADVAVMLSLSSREIYYMIQRGEMPGVRLGRAIRIPVDALEEWIEDKEGQATEKRRHGRRAQDW